MRLTAEMFQQIVDGLKSDSAPSKEKRREPRVGLAAETDLVTVGENGKRQAGKVRVRDLSSGGIGLLFSQPVAKGQRFVLQLESSRGNPVWLICLAAYCKPTRTEFSIGARVQQVMRAEQIAKVEAQSAAASNASPFLQGRAKPAAAAGTTPTQIWPAGSSSPEADIARISKAILD